MTGCNSRALPVDIAVIGIGGAGCKVVRRLSSEYLPGVRLVAVDTDQPSVEKSAADSKVYLRGADIEGTGGIRGWADRCAGACAGELASVIGAPRLSVLVAGMGGGTGTGAISRIAGIAREAGASVVAVVTLPMTHEASSLTLTAGEGVMRLYRTVDALLAIPLESILDCEGARGTFSELFETADVRVCACLIYLLGFGSAGDASNIVGLQVIRCGEEERLPGPLHRRLEMMMEYRKRLS